MSEGATPRLLRDITFAEWPGFRALTLDLHLPAVAKAPVVLFVHGGGWRVGSRRVFTPTMSEAESFERITDAGFAVVSIDYRLSGEAHYPAQLEDVAAGLDWVRSHGVEYGLDASRVVLWGESAGGTMAALVGLDPASHVAGVVDWYGPANLESMVDGLSATDAAATREASWIGTSPLDDRALAREASPVSHVHADAPPFHIAHGRDDQFVPSTQSEEFAATLEATGVDVEFTIVDGADHLWRGDIDRGAILDRALDFVRRVTAPTALSSSALLQQRLWGADPEGWALYSEPHNRPLFEAVLDAARVESSTRLLDVGCGTGLALRLAAGRGAIVSGVDVSPGLLEIARQRLPEADLRLLDLQVLPWPDDSFDAVTGINAFQFAADPVAAIAEAGRVCRPGGRVVVSMFAEPERNESTAIHDAMTALSPPTREAEHEPYALSAPGNLDAAFAAAGLTVESSGEVPVDWGYDEVAHAVRGLRGSGGGTRAVEDVGADAVGRAIEAALVPFTRADGSVVMHNLFRWVSAVKA